MSVVGDFTIPAESFALHQSLTTVPQMTAKADRLTSHSPKEVFPFFWASGGDFETFRQALDGDPTVTEVTVAEKTADEVLYRFTWSDEFMGVVHDMVDHHAAILKARARDDQWNLRLRFAEEGMVTTFQNHFQETGRRFEVNQLYHPTEPRQREFGLTPEQFEALVVATREGYFAVPRTASAEELGEMLGISANSVSQRIRRGCETLTRSALRVTDSIE